MNSDNNMTLVKRSNVITNYIFNENDYKSSLKIDSCKKLEYLCLMNNAGILNLAVNDCKSLKNVELFNLEEIDTVKITGTEKEKTHFYVKGCSNIKTLKLKNLSYNRPGIRDFKNLSVFNTSYCDIIGFSINNLSFLKEINFFACNLQGQFHLIGYLDSLTKLFISNCKFGIDGCKFGTLIIFAETPKLKQLSLMNNNLQDIIFHKSLRSVVDMRIVERNLKKPLIRIRPDDSKLKNLQLYTSVKYKKSLKLFIENKRGLNITNENNTKITIDNLTFEEKLDDDCY